MERKTIEQQVADAILEREVATIEIGGKTYQVASPSIATLILISEIISTLPIVEKVETDDATAMVNSVLHHAKDFRRLGEIAAILILGAKNLTERKRVRRWWGGWREIAVDKKSELAEQIILNVRPSVLWDLIIRRLAMLEIGDFFAITTSLSEANILKPTRGVDQ